MALHSREEADSGCADSEGGIFQAQRRFRPRPLFEQQSLVQPWPLPSLQFQQESRQLGRADGIEDRRAVGIAENREVPLRKERRRPGDRG
jgi:hypothetical protein